MRARVTGQGSKRRGRAVIAAAIVAATVMAACGSDSDSASDTASVEVTDAPVDSAAPSSDAPVDSAATDDTAVTGDTIATGDTAAASDDTMPAPTDTGPITHWQNHSDARAALLEQFVGDYAAAGGSTIEYETIPYSDYFVRLGAALEAGNGPCVFQLPANILAEFQARGQLAPVPDEVMTSAQIEAAFAPSAIKLLSIDDQYYALPTDVQTMMLFYNDDLFEAAGLDPTKDFATWDEFREAAVALTKVDGDTMSQAGVDIASSPYQWYYSGLALQNEQGLVDDTTLQVNYASEAGYDVFQRITDLVTVDHVDDPEFLADQSKFGAGVAGMTLKEYTFNGVYALGNPDLNFSVHMPPPITEGQVSSVASTSWSYAVSADCDNQEGAWQWISYLTSEAAQRIWSAGGGELPSRLELLDDTTLTNDPAVAASFAALVTAVPYDSIGWDDTFAVEQEIWDQIVLNGTDVQSAVDAGAEAENEVYASKGVTK
jgi:multiple sugar transport system substrate-binding protein